MTSSSGFFHGLRNVILSPGGFFWIACLATPHLLEVILPIGEPLGFEYLFAWPSLLWHTVAVLVIYVTFKNPHQLKSLSPTESHVASWYLINGFFFNSMMDVFAGQLQAWTTMTARYNELEPRYAMSGYAGAVILLTSLQEICLQSPCGLLLFYAYWRGCSWRLGVEVVFNMWSVAGVWYFYVTEAVAGFPNMHTPYRADGTLDMSFETMYKFWIGFVIFPALWAIAGICLGIRACSQISAVCHVNDSERIAARGVEKRKDA